jgi:hypothetical protein
LITDSLQAPLEYIGKSADSIALALKTERELDNSLAMSGAETRVLAETLRAPLVPAFASPKSLSSPVAVTHVDAGVQIEFFDPPIDNTDGPSRRSVPVRRGQATKPGPLAKQLSAKFQPSPVSSLLPPSLPQPAAAPSVIKPPRTVAEVRTRAEAKAAEVAKEVGALLEAEEMRSDGSDAGSDGEVYESDDGVKSVGASIFESLPPSMPDSRAGSRPSTSGLSLPMSRSLSRVHTPSGLRVAQVLPEYMRSTQSKPLDEDLSSAVLQQIVPSYMRPAPKGKRPPHLSTPADSGFLSPSFLSPGMLAGGRSDAPVGWKSPHAAAGAAAEVKGRVTVPTSFAMSYPLPSALAPLSADELSDEDAPGLDFEYQVIVPAVRLPQQRRKKGVSSKSVGPVDLRRGTGAAPRTHVQNLVNLSPLLQKDAGEESRDIFNNAPAFNAGDGVMPLLSKDKEARLRKARPVGTVLPRINLRNQSR